jgi:hypothetical protein
MPKWNFVAMGETGLTGSGVRQVLDYWAPLSCWGGML